jgi:hypothetical protein
MSSSRIKDQQPQVEELSFTNDTIGISLVDGRMLVVPLAWYPRLRHASAEERSNYEIFGEGEYIHWPDLDEDLTVTGLLEGRRSAESATSLRRWLASRKATPRTKPQKRAKSVRRAG